MFLLFLENRLSAQITFDTTLQSVNLIYFFNTVQISSTETKYYMADTTTNTFSLFNMDFTPFLTNISVPEPFVDGITTFRVVYVTRSLFDCDTSNIEYAYEAATNSTKTFYIMRTDGTQLFQLDSANGPYCFGDCLGGSDWVKPIVNTSSGAKLFLQRPAAFYNNSVNIYSLCGTLPNEIFDFTNTNPSFINIFPNPTKDLLTFEIHAPNNTDNFDLVVVDNNAREIKHEKINTGSNLFIINVRDFNNGIYFYSLCTKSKSYQNGKFIIKK